MGLRFSKRFQVFPGLRLNVGTRGVSATVGRRGASMTAGKNGVHAQAGLPGTGLSYRTRLGSGNTSEDDAPSARRDWSEGPLGTFFFWVGLVGVVVLGMWALTAFL